MSKLLDKAKKYIRRNKLSSAKKTLLELLKKTPENSEAYYYLGTISLTTGNNREALVYLTKVISSGECHPCWYADYADALSRMKNIEGAAKAYRMAEIGGCATDQFYVKYGTYLFEVARDYKKAELCFAHVISNNPELVSAYFALGRVYVADGRLDEAVQAFGYCLEKAGDNANVYGNLAKAFSLQGRSEESLQFLNKAYELDPSHQVVISNRILELLHFYDDQSLIHHEVRNMMSHLNAVSTLTYDGEIECSKNRKIRLGFVSADFYNHVIVSYFLPILSNLSRDKFTIILYSNNNIKDEVTQHLMTKADVWYQCLNDSDNQLYQRIKEDKVDILLDLSNHTDGNRLKVFAKKPAPIQIALMGLPVSTGLECMDYKFSDVITSQRCALDVNATEEIIELPYFYWYQGLVRLPDIGPLPYTNNGFITFGAFNNPRKTNEKMIEIWSKLVLAVPNSKITMVINDINNNDMREHVYGLFAAHGISKERINLQGKQSLYGYMDSHNSIDIALDTYPYNGETTTYNSLLMGVPVVSCAGHSLPSTASLSILSMIGKEEWVADELDGYIERAIHLASDIDALQRCRSELRQEIQSSDLMDSEKFAMQIESSLITVWERYCQSQTS